MYTGLEDSVKKWKIFIGYIVRAVRQRLLA
jgi:hypothetical protein